MARSLIPLFIVPLVAAAPALAAEVVPLPHFSAVELRGGGSVVIVPGPTERVTVLEGSTRSTRLRVDRHGSLKIDTCNSDCPHHYRLRIEIQSPRVPTLAVAGGGAINVASGFNERQLTVAVNGGGLIDTRAVNASSVTAAVNGGGELRVRAAYTLTGAVSGGGSVRYWGNPQVTSAINGGGSVRPGS